MTAPRRIRRFAAAAAACGVLLGAAGTCGAALAQEPATASDAARLAAEREAAKATGDGVSITQVDSSRFPVVRVEFGADDVDGDTPGLTFFEGREPLTGVSMYRGELGSYEDERRTDLMLVVDTSLSMGNGSRLDDAVAAARELLAHARPGDQVGLATFGGSAKVVLEPTPDVERVEAALDGLELENRTTMFDAVSKAAQAFDADADASRAIVLLSDGTDAGSRESLDEAAGEALKVNAPIFAVAIREDADDQPRDMAQLGNGTGGELRTVVGTSGLDALFDDLGRRLLQPYWIEYRSDAPLRSSPRFGIAVGTNQPASSIDASQAFRGAPSATALGGAGAGDLPKAKPAEPLLPVPGGLLGAMLASVPFAILIFSVVWTQLQRRTKPDVIARIDRYTARASVDAGLAPRDKPRESLIKRLAAPFMAISESFLGRSAFFERIRKRAEQASIAIKPSELFTAMVAMAVLGLLLAVLLGANPLLFLLVPVMGYLPNFWLRMKARKRRNLFDDQLPDVLQGISSSLNAGHSFNQAINAMIKDSPNPTSEEFARVMTEARLGMPIEDALQHMADRMGSADFEFAVTTVNIQRTVGGSLADILEMVGDTVRNRQQFRKKVKALTSMGQMSAYVLLGMPIFIGGALTLINASYMAPLFFTKTGHLLLAAGAFSMILGYFACMKVVSVKV